MIQTREWTDLLMRMSFKTSKVQEDKKILDTSKNATVATTVHDSNPLFSPGDDVLVTSRPSGIIWDASVVAVAKVDESSSVVSYRVHYKEWSSRFDEWVSHSRVLELNDENVEKQVSVEVSSFDNLLKTRIITTFSLHY
jgi:RNA binding activity-knot of a chromodomain.